jgi:calcium/proton exchanger cax
VFVAPVVALLSWAVGPGLPLSFRPVEIVTLGLATVAVAVAVLDGKSKRWEGWALVGVYSVMVCAFWIAGDR